MAQNTPYHKHEYLKFRVQCFLSLSFLKFSIKLQNDGKNLTSVATVDR